MKELSLFWALQNNKIVHISEVENGLKCDCICPVCFSRLEAHQGEHNTHHFKHHTINNCSGALETSIHLASKRLFLTKKEVFLPDLFAEVPDFGYEKVQSKKKYKAKNVFEEYKVDDFQPDIYMEIEVKKNRKTLLGKIFVEIAVTHFVDSEKLSKIEKKGISTIEIHLDKIDSIKNDEELWNELINHNRIKWLFHSRKVKLVKETRENKIQHKRNLENKLLKLNIKRANEMDKFIEEGLSPRKIYKISSDYDRRDMITGDTPIKGTVWCPKDRINYKNKEIQLVSCESCEYHLDIHHATIASDSDVFVICGLEAKIDKIQYYPEE
jgi:hypothetical protein